MMKTDKLKCSIYSLRTFLASMICVMAFSAAADSVDEALTLAEDGNIAEAVNMLVSLEETLPKDARVPLELGKLYEAQGYDAEARASYESSQKKGCRDAILALAEMANRKFEVDKARELVEAYRATLKKGKRTLAPDESGDIDQRIDKTENMLGRVEDLEVIDSLVVDADDFFRYYRLSAESGSLNAPDILPQGFETVENTVVYESQSGRQMIWATPDTAGTYRLVSSAALYGDTWEEPAPLGDELGEGGDANFPFLMPDGITLYYANDGENSIGGLDIFIARKSDDSFLQPQNLGLPYNSPYDDYMLAIDELTGVGWWATDRNRIPGKVTIYVFIPRELRKNLDPDSPDLASRARLASIKDTWKDAGERSRLLSEVSKIKPGGDARPRHQFDIYIPGRGVLTNYEQFHNQHARLAMKEYLDGLAKVEAAREQLAGLRSEYASGNSSVAEFIKQLEASMESASVDVTEMRNRVVELESR